MAKSVTKVYHGSIVFLVLENFQYECCLKLGVFSTRKRAESFIERCAKRRCRIKKREARLYEMYDSDDPFFSKTWRDYVNDFSLVEFELDKENFNA